MTSQERALELIDLTYRTTVETEAWGDLAQALSELFGGAALTLLIQPPDSRRASVVFHVGLDQERTRFAQSTSPEGVAWLSTVSNDLGKRFIRVADYYPQDQLPASQYAREFLEPQGLAVESPIIHLMSPEEAVLSSCIVAYRRADGPRIRDEALGIADLLVPHLDRAIAIHSQLGEIEGREFALHEVIDRIPTGVLILDSKNRPVLVNRMAERILRAQDGLSLSDQGPVAIDRKTTAALRSRIDSAIHPTPGRELAGGGFMGLPRPSGRRDFPVLITPILGREQSRRLAGAAVVLFISDPEFRDVDLSEVLSEIYNLTPAEAELVQLLAQGRSLEEASSIRQVTVNTARSQLKQVFAKTGTRRQSQLLQVVLSSVALVDQDDDEEAR